MNDDLDLLRKYFPNAAIVRTAGTGAGYILKYPYGYLKVYSEVKSGNISAESWRPVLVIELYMNYGNESSLRSTTRLTEDRLPDYAACMPWTA